jgi:DNA-binding NarL/FixJ family response regulator
VRVPAAAQVGAELFGIDRLTTRELDIVTLLVGGDRVRSIAQRLFLSQSTVRSHLSVIFSKFGVRSQSELLDLLRARTRPSTDRDRN